MLWAETHQFTGEEEIDAADAGLALVRRECAEQVPARVACFVRLAFVGGAHAPSAQLGHDAVLAESRIACAPRCYAHGLQASAIQGADTKGLTIIVQFDIHKQRDSTLKGEYTLDVGTNDLIV